MGKFVDKLTSALGFSRSYEDDDYEDYDDYEEQIAGSQSSSRYNDFYDAENNKTYTPSASRTSASRSTGSYSTRSTGSMSSRYESRNDRKESGEMSKVQYSSPSYSSRTSGTNRTGGNKIVNLNAQIQMSVVVTYPKTMEDVQEIALQMKDQKPVIVNLEFTDLKNAQRITDFLVGCCYALNGNFRMISERIFICGPTNVDFAGELDLKEKIQTESGIMIPWQE